MATSDYLRGWRREILLVAGCIVGVGFAYVELTATWGNITAGLRDPNPAGAFRVLQSVGILLPLFTGLLRFTASDHSEVSERVNDYLLLGIIGLVLAGVFATVAGTLTKITFLLKLSLLFVLFAFTIIGFAAVLISKGLDETTETDESEVQKSEIDDEKTHCYVETESTEPEETSNHGTPENERMTEPNPKSGRENPPNRPAEIRSTDSEDGKNR